MSAPLRVALIASNRFPLCQPFAGGLEAHVWHLARALVERGHEVSLFAGSGSDLSLECAALTVRELMLSAAAQADPSASPAAFMADHHAYLNLMVQLADPRSGFDIVHNHSLHHLPVAMAPMLGTPMLTTLHTPPTPWLESALDVTGSAGTRFAAVSRHTAAAWRHVAPDVTVVPNGVDFRRWPLGPGGDNLVWFGRITAEKAPHMAIAAARRADLPLVLAGPISDTAYFKRAIAPSLGDHVRYAGHLNHDELARLVGRSAAALVTPVMARAVRTGGRRSDVVRHARRGIRPWRDTRNRVTAERPTRPAKRRRSYGRRNTGSPVARPNRCSPARRRLLLGRGDGDRIPPPLPHDDRRSE